MKWSEFIEHLAIAKKNKESKGLSVPCITNLIFAGAFDSMVEDKQELTDENIIETYHKMYEQVKKALQSKAALPKKTKAQPIALGDVQTVYQLAVWRFKTNPLSKFDFIPIVEEHLKSRGFRPNKQMSPEFTKDFPYSNSTGDLTSRYPVKTAITKDWQMIFSGKYPTAYKAMKRGDALVAMVGVITKVQRLTYADGQKERVVVEIYNGRDLVGDLTLWPNRDTGKIDKSFAVTLEPLSFGIITLKPKLWGGKRTGTIQFWERFL